MSETCSKCKKGTLTFFDGATEHNPIWVCDSCGYERKDESNNEFENNKFELCSNCQNSYPADNLVGGECNKCAGFFEVIALHRDDLKEYFKPEQIAKLTDDDMRYICKKVANSLEDDCYWLALKEVAKNVINDREQEIQNETNKN